MRNGPIWTKKGVVYTVTPHLATRSAKIKLGPYKLSKYLCIYCVLRSLAA